jgi:hypothetical protein
MLLSRLAGPDKAGAFDSSIQHHVIDVLFKDGVYDP